MGQSEFAAYAKAIALLERYLGATTPYRILDPFSFDPSDIVSVNKAARKIGEFIGLGEHTFIISVKGQPEGVGGNIELRHGEPGAFIEVAEGAAKFEEAVLATLAHELSHKFLYIHEIPITPEAGSVLDDEILTDITAVFLGLGKLMLRGCECKKVSTRQNLEGKVTTTETYRCGYLDRTQLSLAYLLICAMRRIPPHLYEAGLRSEVLDALWDCRKKYSPFLDFGWYERIETSGGATVPQPLAERISQLQDQLAEISRNLLFLQGSLSSAEAFLELVHKRLYQSRYRFAGTPRAIEPDPCLRYLDAAQRAREAPLLAQELNADESKAEIFRKALRKVATLMDAMGPALSPPLPEHYRIVNCRIDGTRLRLPENSPGLTAECPVCHYRFKAITLKPEFGSEKAFWKRFLDLFSYQT